MNTNPASTNVIKTEPPIPALEKVTGILASTEKQGDGTVFAPMEAISAGIRAGNAAFEIIKVVSLLALRGIIAPCEVILRYKIGERYFNPWVSISCLTMVILLFTMRRGEQAFVGAIVLVVFLLGSRIHSLVCFIRDRRGDYWHSYSEGTPWLRIPAIDRFFHRWNFTFNFSTLILEPAALIVAANFLAPFIVALAGGAYFIPFLGRVTFSLAALIQYLGLAAIASFVYHLYCWSERRRMLLDEKDARVIVEAKQLANQPEQPAGIRSYRGVAYAPATTRMQWQQ